MNSFFEPIKIGATTKNRQICHSALQLTMLETTQGELGKRKGASSAVYSVHDVAAWLEAQIDGGGCGNVNAKAKLRMLKSVWDNELNGEVICRLTDSDIKDMFGLQVFGQRLFCQAFCLSTLFLCLLFSFSPQLLQPKNAPQR